MFRTQLPRLFSGISVRTGAAPSRFYGGHAAPAMSTSFAPEYVEELEKPGTPDKVQDYSVVLKLFCQVGEFHRDLATQKISIFKNLPLFTCITQRLVKKPGEVSQHENIWEYVVDHREQAIPFHLLDEVKSHGATAEDFERVYKLKKSLQKDFAVDNDFEALRVLSFLEGKVGPKFDFIDWFEYDGEGVLPNPKAATAAEERAARQQELMTSLRRFHKFNLVFSEAYGCTYEEASGLYAVYVVERLRLHRKNEKATRADAAALLEQCVKKHFIHGESMNAKGKARAGEVLAALGEVA
mmetsp:Transcript_29505/g.74235  ORF Transcript_29505/g.74235 Transcript_29505/m.74235 type:complete len:297 (+) Transcript_29505:84-974(+)|eukprot:CAMPEP_0177650758 /NCGR_PEP_ID=MMETSP0447-20121125/12129_1 /TAXON_ID=0 /ORGANISM="Stygamoeba regulata, Strain BSH-02190019" /LENGTH=296 /DNA_ID=CAMNT_0019153681 /DNA_START=63 /DNA_END=953 /DNA_ORIENTATION=+